METEILAAVKKLVEKAADAEKAGDAQTFAQAALNLAHAGATIEGSKK